MSNEQVLSEAMEVFNRSVEYGTMPGDSPGSRDSDSGVLDRTASGTGTSPGQNDPYGTRSGANSSGEMIGDGNEQGSGMENGTGTASSSGGENGDGTAGTLGTETGPGTGTVYSGYDNAGNNRQDGSGGSPDATAQGQGGSYDMTGRRVIIVGSQSGGMTDEERVGNYDRELEEQMRVFDGIILGSRQESIARSNEDGAGDIATASASGGYGSDTGSETAPLLTASRSRDPNNNQTMGQMPDAPSDNRQGDYSNQSGERDDRIPEDISDGSDDDIVARQLREAAMAEEDPELREKLWDEYRKYKEGVQARR